MKYEYLIDEINPDTSHGKIIERIAPGSVVLECGCASGYITRYLSEKLNCSMYVVEREEEGFQKARRYALDGICADLMSDDWPEYFAGKKFDFITFMDVLEHIYDPGKVLEMALPLLKDEGQILVSIPNICHNDIIMKLVYNDWEYTPLGLLDDSHIRFWGLRNLVGFFQNAGFKIIDLDYTICPTTFSEQDTSVVRPADPILYEMLRNRPYGEVYQFIITLEKAVETGNKLQEHRFTWNPLQPSGLQKASLAELIRENEDLKSTVDTLKSVKDRAVSRAEELEESLSKSKENLESALEERHKAEKKLAETIKELNEKTRHVLAVDSENERLRSENEIYIHRCNEYVNSNSWKITKPYRALGTVIKKLFGIKPDSAAISEKESPKVTEVIQRKENNPLVTVAIPVYDRTDVLIESIESILAQTYPAVEIIAVCDGSPSETLEIIRSYERRGLIRAYYYPDNSGNAVRGRNRAIQEARGEFLAFQDSDDIAEPDRIRLSVEMMQREGCDVVYGGWRALVEDREGTGLENGQEVFSPDCDLDYLREICVPCQSTVMVRTAALRKVGGLKSIMRYREDHELWLRLAYNGYKFKAIQHVLTNLRLHGSNLELSFKDGDEHWKELMLKEYTVIRPMPERIAFLIPGCDISGGIKIACSYANYLKARGCFVCFLCTGTVGSLDWFPDQQVEILSVDQAPGDLDIIVSTFWSTVEYSTMMEAKRRIYLIQSDERNFYSPGSPEVEMVESTYRRQDQEFVVIASWMRDWLADEFGADAMLLPNGIDYAAFANAQPLLPRGDNLRILIEGDPDSQLKGVGDAFRIAERSGAEIWYVKPTPGKSSFTADREFDHIPNDMMPSIYASCHVLLKTSRYESFCLPALEMMATGGVPVISRVNGITDYLQDGKNGFIVELYRQEDALERIEMLKDSSELLKSMGENAKKTAEAFDFRNTLEKMYEFFVQTEEEKSDQ